MLTRNVKDIGQRPICIAFNGTINDFKTVFDSVLFMFNNDKKLIEKKKEVYIFKRLGIFGGNKRIYIVPRKIIKEMREKEEKEKQTEKE